MMSMITLKKMVGVRKGNVTAVNTRQMPAPSMRAASRNSSGTPCSPAR